MSMDAPSPGTVLRDALKARGWSQGQLALLAGMRQQHVWLICKGERRITSWVASRLENGFRDAEKPYRTAKEWIEIQGAWDLASEKQEVGT